MTRGSDTDEDGLMPRLFSCLRRHEGQTMAEYSVALGVITVGIVLAIGSLSDSVVTLLQSVVNAI